MMNWFMLQIADTFFLRLAVCSTETTSEDIALAWQVVQEAHQHIQSQHSSDTDKPITNGAVKTG